MNPGSRNGPGRILRLIAPAAVLILLTLAVDLWGIHWGIPSPRHIRSFHPDEWRVIEAAERINLAAGRINPGFYNYGSLYVYVLSIAYSVAQLFGLMNAHPPPQVFDAANQACAYLVARGVTVLFSVGLTLTTWQIGDRVGGRVCGIAAGVLLSVSPLYVVESHYAAVDIPATFWMAVSVLCALVAVERSTSHVSEKSGARPAGGKVPVDLIFSAVAAGLAVGTKYNAGACLFACWVAWFQILRNRPAVIPAKTASRLGELLFGMVVTSGAAFAAFLLSTPGVITDQVQFVTDFLYEMRHSSTGHEFVFSDTAPAWIYHITHSLWIGLGPPLCVLALIGCLYALVRHTDKDILMAAATVPYYVLIGLAQVKFMRYALPILPFLCVWTARMVTEWWGRKTESRGRAALARAACLCLTAAGIFAFLETAAYDDMLARPDVRDVAADWIFGNVEAGSSIGMPDTPWFDSPPLIPLNVHAPPDFIIKRQESWPYRFILTGWNAAKLEQDRPQYFLLSEWQSRYRLRLHRLDPGGTGAAAVAGREAAQLMDIVQQRYSPVRTFQSVPHLGPLAFHWSFVPDDWLYPDPAITLYERRP